METMHYHIVGIAGAGMSAMANLLLDQGQRVTGSDLLANRQTEALVARGAVIAQGHAAVHVEGADALLTTSAVGADHVELGAARAAGIPILHRADLWRHWSAQRPVIAIAGSHGKTTTSAMVALALRATGLNAGYLIGAEVPDLGGNAAWGDPHAPLVIEADEYDRAFLALTPDLAVITNVEWDHPDIYATATDYQAAFKQFAAGVVHPDRVILCADDLGALALDLPAARLYGIEEQLARDPVSCRLAPLDWAASGVELHGLGGVSFDLWHYNRRRMAQQHLTTQELRLPGLHNVRNALAALAVVNRVGGDLAAASRALAAFRGTARRFEWKGEVRGITLVDDYAHHPTEVRATLAAARARYPGRRIVAYLQPHTFSRTIALYDAWATACDDADLLLVGDIYAARESGDRVGVARELTARIAASGVESWYVGGVTAAAAALLERVQPGDLVVTLGAGDGDSVGRIVLEQLTAR